MRQQNQWHVITGGPSTGKTTLITEFSKRGYATVPEAARTVIDEAIEQGIAVEQLRADERRFQYDVAKLKQKIESEKNKDTLTFFDRGMHDTEAYLRFYDYEMTDWLEDLMTGSGYKSVFLLHPLPQFEEDYARTEGAEFIERIHDLLYDVYTRRGMTPIIVPPLSVEDRVEFILSRV